MQVGDEVAELGDFVLQRCAGEQDRPLRGIDEASCSNRPLRLWVLYVVSFVDHDARQVAAFVQGLLPPRQRLVRRDGHPAIAHPHMGCAVALRPMDPVRSQFRLADHFAGPVGHYGGRAHYQEVGFTSTAQVREDGNGFDSLAEPHLVPDDDLALHESEAGREALVTT